MSFFPVCVYAIHVCAGREPDWADPLLVHGDEPAHRYCGLALLVFFIVVVYGFWRHGLHFLNLFVPKGVPIYILP